MRLRSVWIGDYKNLKDFSITFEGDNFIDIFVGKNGSGKSNFLEALVEIFDHIYSGNAKKAGPSFDYDLHYEIADREIHLTWRDGDFSVDGNEGRQALGQTPAPDHLLVYYSGQNDQVSGHIRRYEESFRDDLRTAIRPIAPKIIGIGSSCRKLLIVTLLMLNEDSQARQFLCNKLGIISCRRSIDLTIAKPFFVQKNDHDPIDLVQRFWGVTGYIQSFLQHLLDSVEGGFGPGELYDREAGLYRLTCNIDLLNNSLGDETGLTLFRSLEALRVLGMLSDIRLPFALEGLEVSELNLFSDGQFQSVYLFGIAELFKDLNCVALLDEPDAFLHPEWQFEFLNQIETISEQASRTNHFLLSSHSASTIAAEAPGRIRLLAQGEGGIQPIEKDKTELVQSLSAGLITFSEQEAALSIERVVLIADSPVLFTEGITDALIMRCAWDKLNPGTPCPFAIEQGYGKGFLRNLFTNPHLFDTHPEQSFFALFDFDDAFKDWNQLGTNVETDARIGLAKQWNNRKAFGLLLPVPEGLSIEGQVLKADGSGNFGDRSRLSIELMFRDVPELDLYFEADPDERDGCIRFLGDKLDFAKNIVPNLAAEHFACFQTIFDFIREKS